MKKGEKVQTVTRVVGQTPRTGVVVAVREDREFVEVEWDDGHRSTVSARAVVPLTTAGPRRPK